MAGRLSTAPSHAKGYELIGDDDETAPPPTRLPGRSYRTVIIAFLTCVIICLGFKLVSDNAFSLRVTSSQLLAASDCPCTPSKVPQYFDTTAGLWAVPTATGKAPFLAQTRTFDPTATYVPNAPLQTSIPIEGMGAEDRSIFNMMGFVFTF